MTDAEARRIVRATLTELGLNVTDPDDVIEAQRDFSFLRRQRKASERIGFGVRMALITTAISGVLAAIAISFKVAITGRL